LALAKVCRLTQHRGSSDAEDCRATKTILDLYRRKFRVPALNIILRCALTTVLCRVRAVDSRTNRWTHSTRDVRDVGSNNRGMTPISTLTVTPFGPTHARNRLTSNDRFILVCQLAGFSPSFPGRRPAQHASGDGTLLCSQFSNRTTIGQSALARLRHPIGGRGLLPSELQDLTLTREVWATKRTQSQLWLSPEVPLGNTGVGRHSSRRQPAFPTPGRLGAAWLLVVRRGWSRGNVGGRPSAKNPGKRPSVNSWRVWFPRLLALANTQFGPQRNMQLPTTPVVSKYLSRPAVWASRLLW
jgi:hypothetical protein